MTVRWAPATPAGGAGAIAAIALSADDAAHLDRALAAIAPAPVAVGEVRLRDLLGVDRGVVARWSPTRADLMPHAGPAITRALAEHLAALLGPASEPLPAREAYPEAGDHIETEMLAALARAHSPRAIDLLLDQPRRWQSHAPGAPEADAVALDRLIDPPLVVSVGPPNIGKSSLLNALAGRCVAITADEPGTTRDHVGAMLELDGVAVRFVDTPGSEGPSAPGTDQAGAIAQAIAARADLILRCFDARSEPPAEIPANALRVATRVDLAAAATAGPPRACPRPGDAATSAATGQGIDALARLIRARLVPDAALADTRPWRFWREGHHSPP